MSEYELYHYGVKGMKWGVRRSREVRSVNKRYQKDRKELDESFKTEFKSGHKKYMRSVPLTKKRRESLSEMKTTSDNYKNARKDLEDNYKKSFKEAANKAQNRMETEKAAGKAGRDFNKLRNAMQKNENAYSRAQKSVKNIGQAEDEGGNKLFDLYTGNKKLMAKADKTQDKAEALLSRLSSKYDNVSAVAGKTKDGRDFVEITLGNLSDKVYADD